MTYGHFMGGFTSNRYSPPLHQRGMSLRPRSEGKRSRILEAAMQHFAKHGYHSARVGDIAVALGIAKGSIFQHFGTKDSLFLEVYKRAARSLPKYLDAPTELRQAGFFDVLRHRLVRIERLLHQDSIPYRVLLLGNYGTDLALKCEINRFLMTEDPCGTVDFVRFGLERRELRKDIDLEMMVSILDWTTEHFQDTLLTSELDSGLFRRPGEFPETKEARIQQFLAILQRAIGFGTETARPAQRSQTRGSRGRPVRSGASF